MLLIKGYFKLKETSEFLEDWPEVLWSPERQSNVQSYIAANSSHMNLADSVNRCLSHFFLALWIMPPSILLSLFPHFAKFLPGLASWQRSKNSNVCLWERETTARLFKCISVTLYVLGFWNSVVKKSWSELWYDLRNLFINARECNFIKPKYSPPEHFHGAWQKISYSTGWVLLVLMNILLFKETLLIRIMHLLHLWTLQLIF